ncbi:MAG: HD domain-containing protein [candidate division WOR-3 bacterium]
MNIAASAQTLLERLGRPYESLLHLARNRELYMVGGTVRDIVLGRDPTDFDFAVRGSGIDFARALARRLRANLVLLSEPDDQARVVVRLGTRTRASAARSDNSTFILDFNGFNTGTIRDDLERRDFTANAIALRISTDRKPPELLDPFHGQQAIRDRRLIPVSERSLELDPLRLLRAIRFALELGFEIDETILHQARGISLEHIAPERIGYELMRIMACDKSYRHVRLLYQMGFLLQILPEARPLLTHRELMRHSLGTYRKLEQLISRSSFFSLFQPEFEAYFATHPHSRALLKLAGLLHDIGKPETEFINDQHEVHFYGHDALGARRVAALARDRLRLARDEIKVLKTLVEYHMRLHLLATGPSLTDRAIRRYFRDLGEQWFGLMMLTFADGFATAGVTRHLETKFAQMIELKRQYDAVVKIERLVNGHDLIRLGLRPGPQFKTILTELEELQIEGRITSKEQGLDYIRTNLARLNARPEAESGSESLP